MVGKSTVKPVSIPKPWRGDDMAETPWKWLRPLNKLQIDELLRIAAKVEKDGLPLSDIQAGQYPLPTLEKDIAEWRRILQSGAGMVLVRGLPVRKIGKKQAAIIYWLIGLFLGTPVSQNNSRETLVDIRDTGSSPKNLNTRLYKTREKLTFHTDGADVIGLLCLRSGKSGGKSRICSSVEVYNQICSRRPDLAPLLEQSYHHHAHGQYGPNGPKTFEYPIVTRDNDNFRMMLLLWYIRNAAIDFPEIAALSELEREMLDLLEAIPEEEGIALDMAFQEGDMQFLKNSVVLHARSDYEDWDDPEEKRHLLRLWLVDETLSDGDKLLRNAFPSAAK